MTLRSSSKQHETKAFLIARSFQLASLIIILDSLYTGCCQGITQDTHCIHSTTAFVIRHV